MKTTKTKQRFSKSELARQLGFSRQTVTKWLSDPSAPKADSAGTFDISEAACFLNGHVDEARVGGATGPLREARLRKLHLECEEIEARLKAARKEYIARSELIPVCATAFSSLTANLRARFENELPSKYLGLDEIGARQLNIEAIDFVLRRLKSDLKGLGEPGQVDSVAGV